MDTDTLVADRIEEGQNLLDRLGENQIELIAACWVRSSEDDRWTLYVSTPIVDRKGPLAAYREVLGVLRSMEANWLTADNLVLIGEKHPVTGDVLSILQNHTGMTRTRRPFLGDTPVQEVYVYRSSPRYPRHTQLNDGEKQLLESLYARTSLTVDDLPYTDELDKIHRDFVQQSGLALTVRDVFKALKNLGRQGRLGGKGRSSVLPDPGNTPFSPPPVAPT
jgi:hypothetical protein